MFCVQIAIGNNQATLSRGLTISVLRDKRTHYIFNYMTNIAVRPETSALVAEFAGGSSSDVSMMIGVGLVKDSEGVFFQYLGDEQQPSALMLPSGKPLTRMSNVRLSAVEIAEDIGEFKSTKLNLILETTSGTKVMLTSGLTTIWSQCVLTSLMGLYQSYSMEEFFQLDTWKGTSKLRPCFAAIRVAGNKISDQETYDLLRDARSDRDNALVQQLCRNAVTQLQAAVGIEPVAVTEETNKEEIDF